MSGKLFISYLSDDRLWVDRLADALRGAGWDAWVDREEISGGAEWRTSIVRGVKTADAFLIVLSPASVRSKNVVKELSLAEEFGRRIIPIQQATAEEGSDFKYQLAGLQRISFVDMPWNQAIERLLTALEAMPTVTEGPFTIPTPAPISTLPGTPNPPTPEPRKSPLGLLLAGGVLLLAAGAALLFLSEEPATVATESTPAPAAAAEPTPEPAPEPTPSEAAAKTIVSRLVIAHEVVDSEPNRLKRPFKTGKKVYAFTEVHADAATRITHRYSREGKVLHSSELDVKPGRYRTWSYVTARDPGDYAVVVLDAAGKALSQEEFSVRK